MVAVDSSDEDPGACNTPRTDLVYRFLLNGGPHASTGDFGINESNEPERYRSFCPLVVKEGWRRLVSQRERLKGRLMRPRRHEEPTGEDRREMIH